MPPSKTQTVPGRVGWLMWQAALVPLLVAVLIALHFEVVAEVYWGPLATEVGWVINGAIMALFLAALLRMSALLRFYFREDRAISAFDEQMDFGLAEGKGESLAGTLVMQRYQALEQGQMEMESPNQSALAGILWNQEAARLGLTRLIQNVLILLGVFGTVVSLSLALIGASELFSSPQDASGITLVVRGMATALSTTMTAIAAYLVLAFVLSRTLAAQAHVCRRIEAMTLSRMLPLFGKAAGGLPENLLHALGELRSLLADLRDTHATMQKQAVNLSEFERARLEHEAALLKQMRQINQALREGFRLRDMGGPS